MVANGVFIPLFADIATSPRYDELVRYSWATFRSALERSESIPTAALHRWLSNVTASDCQQVYRGMDKLHQLVWPIVLQQDAENGPVMEILRSKGAV